MSKKMIYVAAIAVLGTAAPALAHHSFAMFDQGKVVELTGTMQRMDWTNPHVYFTVVVKAANGGTDTWAIEGAAPNGMSRQGWSRIIFKPGDPISVVVHPRKNGEKEAQLLLAKTGAGKMLWRNEDRPSVTLTN